MVFGDDAIADRISIQSCIPFTMSFNHAVGIDRFGTREGTATSIDDSRHAGFCLLGILAVDRTNYICDIYSAAHWIWSYVFFRLLLKKLLWSGVPLVPDLPMGHDRFGVFAICLHQQNLDGHQYGLYHFHRGMDYPIRYYFWLSVSLTENPVCWS